MSLKIFENIFYHLYVFGERGWEEKWQVCVSFKFQPDENSNFKSSSVSISFLIPNDIYFFPPIFLSFKLPRSYFFFLGPFSFFLKYSFRISFLREYLLVENFHNLFYLG